MASSAKYFALLLSMGLAASAVHATPTNLALGAPASASGLYVGNGYSIAGANDGNLGTAWNGGAHDAWWQVDLQAVANIDQVIVSSGDGPGYHTTFQLSSSVDGSTWSLIGAPTTGSGPSWSFSFQTAGAAMRYINYTTIGEPGSDWATLAELQAIGQAGGPSGAVPLPASLGLSALGLGLLAWRRRAGALPVG